MLSSVTLDENRSILLKSFSSNEKNSLSNFHSVSTSFQSNVEKDLKLCLVFQNLSQQTESFKKCRKPAATLKYYATVNLFFLFRRKNKKPNNKKLRVPFTAARRWTLTERETKQKQLKVNLLSFSFCLLSLFLSVLFPLLKKRVLDFLCNRPVLLDSSRQYVSG